MNINDRDILVKIRIQKAVETIEDAKIAIENKRYRNALNRIYYSIFYTVSALALKNDFSTSKHKQLMGWFIKNFVASKIVEPLMSDIYKQSFDRRQEGDYDDITEFDINQIEQHYSDMLIFVNEIKKLIDIENA